MNYMNYPFDAQQSFNNLSLNQSYDPNMVSYSSQEKQGNGVEQLKLELQIKETQIESLEQEIQTFKRLLENKQKNVTDIQIPTTLENIFAKLADSLHAKEKELQETKETLESLITAITLNPTNSITKDGRYDPESIAHKLLNRLEILTQENKEMGQMLSYGRGQDLLIRINLMTKENQELKQKITLLEQKIASNPR